MSINAIAQRAVSDAISHHGESATYTASGWSPTSTTPTIWLAKSMQGTPGFYEADAVEPEIVAYMDRTEISAPRRGDTFVIDDVTYTVDRVVDKNDWYVVAAVR